MLKVSAFLLRLDLLTFVGIQVGSYVGVVNCNPHNDLQSTVSDVFVIAMEKNVSNTLRVFRREMSFTEFWSSSNQGYLVWKACDDSIAPTRPVF